MEGKVGGGAKRETERRWEEMGRNWRRGGEEVGGGGALDRLSQLTNHAPARDRYWSAVDD